MPDDQQQAIRELVEEWMRHADSDLTNAKMVDNEEIAPEIIAFHAQQAVEKALKALLIQRQIDFPRTHIIGVLLSLCSENGYQKKKRLPYLATLWLPGIPER